MPGLEAATNGRLKIDFLAPGEHPYKSGDMVPALSERKCDMIYAHYASASYADPRLGAADLPFLQPSGGHTVKKDMHRLLAPLYAELLSDWNAFELADGYNPPQHFWHVNRWLEDIDSMKGQRIRTWCPELDNVVEMLDATPVRIDPAEAYTALQTGLLDGLITGVVFCVRVKMPEVVKVYQPLDVFQTSLVFLVNQDSWNELPSEIQDAVMAYMDLRSEYLADAEIREEPMRLQEAVDVFGLQIGPVPPGLREELVAHSYEGVWKPWAERVGPGGAEFLDLVVKTIEAAGYKVPGYPH
jgi:TRAP-type C4-dicarboxylate transport system substrate-binding protein